MSRIRRALVLASAERYVGVVVQLGLIAMVSRLLTPEEVGVNTIGTGLMMILLSLREFASADFLVQRKTLTPDEVRTTFTLLFGIGALLGVAIAALAPAIGASYGTPGLADFLRVVAIVGLFDAVRLPLVALLQRDLAFGTLAVINVVGLVTGAVVTVGLAALGHGYMSFAWAWLATSVLTSVLALCLRPELDAFRFRVRAWRPVTAFGGWWGAGVLLMKLHEALPPLVLGRLLPLSAVGLYNRATMVSMIPERVILSQVYTVAFPAFAAQARDGQDVGAGFLRAVSYVSVVHWPFLAVLGLLAHPLVLIVLGDQWTEIVPLVRILAFAAMFGSPAILSLQALGALGALRHKLLVNLITRPIAVVALCGATFFGLTAMAFSQCAVLALQLAVALFFFRRNVPVAWRDLGAVVRHSLVVTVAAAAPCLVALSMTGFGAPPSIGAALIAGGLSVTCWMGAIWLSDHPVKVEVERLLAGLAGHRVFARLLRLASR
jgi:O-antigen/teichoic acid export membrane protein